MGFLNFCYWNAKPRPMTKNGAWTMKLFARFFFKTGSYWNILVMNDTPYKRITPSYIAIDYKVVPLSQDWVYYVHIKTKQKLTCYPIANCKHNNTVHSHRPFSRYIKLHNFTIKLRFLKSLVRFRKSSSSRCFLIASHQGKALM